MKTILASLLAAGLCALSIPAASAAPDKAAVETRPSFGWFESDGPLRQALRGALRRWLAFHDETPLTDRQKAEIREILKPHRDEIREAVAAMRTAQGGLHDAITKGGDVNKAADAVGAAARQGALLRARLAAEIRPKLTPEQLSRLDAMFDQFQSDIGKLSAAR